MGKTEFSDSSEQFLDIVSSWEAADQKLYLEKMDSIIHKLSNHHSSDVEMKAVFSQQILTIWFYELGQLFEKYQVSQKERDRICQAIGFAYDVNVSAPERYEAIGEQTGAPVAQILHEIQRRLATLPPK